MKNYHFKPLFVLVLSVLGLVVHAEPVETSVSSVRGTVESSAPGANQYTKLNKNDRLSVGSRVRTGPDGAAFISPFPGAAIQVGSNSETTLTVADLTRKGDKVSSRKVVLDLTKGSAVTSLDPGSKTDYRINIARASIRSSSGAFSVTPSGNGSYTVVVLDGSVEVTMGNVKKRVPAGKKLVIFADGSSSEIENAAPNELSFIESSRQVAIALRLIKDEGLEEASNDVDVGGGVGLLLDDTLLFVNPANTLGETSPQ